MIDVFEALRKHIARGFFAANATCAVHCDFFMFGCVEVLFDPFGKLCEDFGVWVDCAFKCSDFGFIFVACVEEEDIGIVDEIVPVFWRNVFTDLIIWVCFRFAKGYELFFLAYFEAVKGLFFCGGVFEFAGFGAHCDAQCFIHELYHGVHVIGVCGDCTVNSFGRDQERAAD